MTERVPLVFLPGLLCDAALWQAQADALADVADPIIIDLTADDSVAAMADRALERAPDRFALAALSMGGYVAFEILRRAPERVTRLALFDTSAAPDDAARVAKRRAGIESLKVGRFAGVTGRTLPRLVHPKHVDGPVGEALKVMAGRVGGAAFLRQQEAILGRPDSRPILADIHVPTVIGVGDGDVLTPVHDALEIHHAVDGSKFHLFHGCGHLPALEQPEETTKVLRRWLDA
ncbi:alpha/beta fold hydrolase [Acuticoccus kandeliae]|uniref:alpha/beta fold hydrolase n=1 Tax=Acuticoccus kandeliae TaxID=2073160 RepID=UPI00196A70CE|nr:alpha/beta fold hydrolase [Acuticoccus kandeliae]